MNKKETVLNRMGLFKESVLTKDEAIEAHLEGISEAFVEGCKIIDTALDSMIKFSGKISEEKRKHTVKGICDILTHLEVSIAETKSILQFNEGSRNYSW